MQKVKLSMAQRQTLAKIFNDEFRNNKLQDQLGSTQKAFYQEAVRSHFMPLRSPDLPAYPVEAKEIKDDDGVMVDTEYTFVIVLNFNQVGEGTTLTITKPIKKSFLDHVI